MYQNHSKKWVAKNYFIDKTCEGISAMLQYDDFFDSFTSQFLKVYVVHSFVHKPSLLIAILLDISHFSFRKDE